ncbi:LapA family protein [Brucella endophytica]|nr:LapA family protein [Brucella endophytica]
MTNRFVTIIILVPLAIVLVALSVANREMVTLTLDPFNPGNPALSWSAPLFVWLFGALIAGLILGSAATWVRQGKHRKRARESKAEADRLRREVETNLGATPPSGLPPISPTRGEIS